MKNSQKGFTSIILIALVVILAGAFGYVALVKKSVPTEQQSSLVENTQSTSPATVITTNTPTQIDEIASWQNHLNKVIGFSFKYPNGWRVYDSFELDTHQAGYILGSLNLYNSVDPMTKPPLREGLKENVMSAEFQRHESKASNRQDFIKNLQAFDYDIDINQSSIGSLKNEAGLDIIKFEGRIGGDGSADLFVYIIPQKSDFSEVVQVNVRNFDPMIEKVLSTFKFIPSKK